MKFTEHRDSNINTVKHYEPGLVKINGQSFTKSCFFNQHTDVTNWHCQNISELNELDLDQLIQLKPEVIILGSGDTQVFPKPKLFSYCAQHGIGLEVMANDSACRTYNVLTTEDREVVLALIIN